MVICDTDKDKLQKIVFFIFIPDQWLHIRVFSPPFVFPTYTNPHKLRSKPRQHFLIDKLDHRSFWCYETLFVKLLVKYKSVFNILQVILFELQQQPSEMI